MHRFRKSWELVCACLVAGLAQHAGIADELPGPDAPSSRALGALGEKFDPEKLRADFRLARQALEEGHGGIYRYTPKEELDRRFERAEKSLTKPMSAVEFCRFLAPVVAAIKCGHTGVWLPREIEQMITEQCTVLPLDIRVLGAKVYILRDFSEAQASLAGKEIRALNGIPAAKIVEQLLAAEPGDGDIQASRMLQISSDFSLKLLNVIGLESPYELTVWDPNQKRETQLHLEGVGIPRLRESARAKVTRDQRSQPIAELTFLDDRKIAVMNIRQFAEFVDAERKKTLKEFYQESFSAMETNGTKALILDLRSNGGGADELGKLLLSYLLEKPFQYYDDLVVNALDFSFRKYTNLRNPPPADALERQPNGKYRLVKHPNWGLQQPSQPTFRGRVLILMNGRSFSTTAEFLSLAHYHQRATFIGEESGGGYYGNSSGGVPALTLPHTKVVVRVPLLTYYLAVRGYQARAHGVVPDYPIPYSIEELLEGKDKELALALELARKSL